jgi:two-component system response regulator YesN
MIAYDRIIEILKRHIMVKKDAYKKTNDLSLNKANRVCRTKEKADGHQKNYVEKAVDYIHRHINEPLSLELIAKNTYISSFYLSHLFHQVKKTTVGEYINRKRIEVAIKMMKDHRLLVKEVAKQIGYADAGYFSKTFIKYLGINPKQYMRQIHKEPITAHSLSDNPL